MSTNDIQTCQVLDDRLCVTDELKFGVKVGAQSVNVIKYPAISSNSSNHTFNIQMPSRETVCDRRVLWQSQVNLAITVYNNDTNAHDAMTIINYGASAQATATSGMTALAPFPLHQLCQTQLATINNTTVSLNTRDLLPQYLRFNDKRSIYKYNSLTPCQFDTYRNYADASGANNNPLAAWGTTSDNDIVQRGAWPAFFYLNNDNTTPLTGSNAPVNAASGGNPGKLTIYMSFQTTEPLLLSPFIFCDPTFNNQGFYGLQTMNFVFNIGTLNRVIRTAIPFYDSDPSSATMAANPSFFRLIGMGPVTFNTNAPSGAFPNSELLFTWLTPKPSQLLPSRNVVPYYNTPRYFTNVAVTLPQSNGSDFGKNTYTISTQSVQLNTIPDKIAVVVRKPMNSQTINDADCFLPIVGVSVNFNNQSGLLSNATQQQLYEMSVKNGSNQSWYEFNGWANTNGSGTNLAQNIVPTCGSVLILDFATDIQLPESFYAPCCLGTFTLQLNIQVSNNTVSTLTSAPYEVVLMTVDSGCLVSEQGQSQTFTGILSKQAVLDASEKPRHSHQDVQRLVGGGFWSTLGSIAGAVANTAEKLAPVAKNVLANIPDARAQGASQALGALGYGASGGHREGSGGSGGRRHKMGDMRL